MIFSRWLLVSALIFVVVAAAAQEKEKLHFAAGVSIPTGEDLRSVFDFGLDLGVGRSFYITDRIFLNPQAVFVYYINNPTKDVRDNFIQYGGELKIGYHLIFGKIEVRPQAGIGYLWGTDFLSPREGDFDERWLYANTRRLLKTQATTAVISADILVSPKIRLGVTYRFQRPLISLDDEYKNSFPGYNTSTSLYGKVVEFPDQRFNFDSISLSAYYIIR